MQNFKTAIVHDWFTNYAGSERVVESLTNIYPDADIFTLVDFLSEEERKIILKEKKPNTSFIQKLPFAKTKHRKYLVLFPLAIEQFDLSGYDLIISSSHAVAKGVLTNSNQLHICYCHTPMRYAWDLSHQYLKETNLDKGLLGWGAKKILHYLRIWDSTTANRVDYYIANSIHIAKRIKKIYDRDSVVIYPPVDINKFECSSNRENFYLTASRMVPYKRIDLIVEAFSQMSDKKLVVVGHGPEMDKIKSKATNNIEILGYLPDDELKKYMQKAKAFIFAAEEDFGIIVIEAMACGTPVIAYNKGGIAETVFDGENGILFNVQTPEAIRNAVARFEREENKFDSNIISQKVQKFGREIFEKNIRRFVDSKTSEFFGKKPDDRILV